LSRWLRRGSNGVASRAMSGSWPPGGFPGLDQASYLITSPVTRRYNCLAWGAGESERRWEPDALGQYYWPPGIPRELTLNAFSQAYETLGYRLCYGSALEEGRQKIAIFAIEMNGIERPTHVALQLESGSWTSKLGDCEDIEHFALESLNGPLYGRPVIFMHRARPKQVA